MAATFLVCALVTAASAVTSLGFSIAALRSTGEAQVNAFYAVSRSLALAVVSVVPFISESRSWLLAVAVAMTIVQALDGYVGIRQRDSIKTYGPFFLAIVNLIALILLATS